jgi:hypothetical protein
MKIVDIARPTADEPMWCMVIRTRAGRQWVLLDHTLRGAIKLFRQSRRAKCWDQTPIRPEDAIR